MTQPIYVDNIKVASATIPELPQTIANLAQDEDTIYFEGFEEVIQGLATLIKEIKPNVKIRMVQNV